MMSNKIASHKSNGPTPIDGNQAAAKYHLLPVLGYLGVAIAAPFFLWVPLGFLGLTPSLIDVFGIVGLRFPAALTIAGLLLSAIGFHRF
ncbi:MAG: hypothetical protein ACI82A_004092 [Candidatus Azotimanducaceae bacterium]|jgi:hypothetical protein